jgi:hypothetical protein
MSSASEFTLAALSPADVAFYADQRAKGYSICSGSFPRHPCHLPILFAGAYSYTTGIKGRRTIATRHFCAVHAEQFAQKHGLAWPVAAVPK